MAKKQTKDRTAKKAQANELAIARTFEARREVVWRAWTDPAQLKEWWGPKGFTMPVWKADFRVGGAYLYCMRSPDGKDYWGTGVYREIVHYQKIVATDSFADESGQVVPATHYGMTADMPLETLVTVTFEALRGRTKVTLTHAGLPAGTQREGAEQGWGEALEKLADRLRDWAKLSGVAEVTMPSDREVVMSRVFDAPRERVFQAYTDPKLLPKWWGPRGFTTVVETMDVRPGGAWRYVHRGPDGNEYAFHGEYREVVPPRRLVSTFEFEGAPGHVVVDTATFEERGGKTKVTVTSRFESVEDRDGMYQAGAEEGARESWDRLAELLAKP